MNNYFDNNIRLNTNDRPIINREQNYFLERTLITIHSEDRDISKYKYSNNFAIRLPRKMKNVESMRLVEIQLPVNNYTFSNYNQNTKLSFTIQPKDINDNYYNILNDNSNNYYTITIQDGFYTLKQLELELKNKMNDVVTKYILDNSGGNIVSNYTGMKVIYDSVGQKFWFGNLKDSFSLIFNKQEYYDIPCNNVIAFNQYTNWGLPFNIGFEKKIYNSISSNEPIKFSYLENVNFLYPSNELPVHYIEAHHIQNIACSSPIYMEVNKYNSMDELKPYTDSSKNTICISKKKEFLNSYNGKYNDDYNGRVNSAFAKIPMYEIPNGLLFDSKNGFLDNVKTFILPEKQISILEFKFRYHDGRLVDFCNCNFNFTIEFNTLRDDINKNYNIRHPYLYNL